MDVPGLQRKAPENPFKYTEDDQTEKRLALKKMQEAWPDVSPLYAEWVYDLCKNTTPERMAEIIKRIDTNPPRKPGEEMVWR